MSGCSRTILSAVALLAVVAPVPSWADPKNFDTQLSGFNEVHAPTFNAVTLAFSGGSGAIFSTGSGQLKLRVNENAREISYELTYDFPDAGETPINGNAFVNQAHLHFGQKHTTGGIAVWLCQGDNAGPAGTPVCPSPSGTVTGIIRPANVLALAGQGFPGGEEGFDALLEALREGTVYGNVHTDRFGPGEIRGQLGKHGHD
jgi:hypothetical protein